MQEILPIRGTTRQIPARGVQEKVFGDEVPVLQPNTNNKLLMHWQGLFEVTAKLGSCDFQIKFGRKQNACHMNLLKKCNRLEKCDQEAVVVNVSVPADGVSSAAVLLDTVAAMAGILIKENEPELSHVKIELPGKGDKGETPTNVRYDKELDSERKAVLREGFVQREWTLTDKPGD